MISYYCKLQMWCSLLTTAKVLTPVILYTLKMGTHLSSENSVDTRVTRRNIPVEAFFTVTAVKTSNRICY
jgi:hypothetical protein